MKISWYVVLLLAAYLFTAWVCVIQDDSIRRQASLIHTFQQSKGCMNDPRK